jgi:DNA-binding winged helix-turn-helix (wHTH) protein
MSRGVTFRFGTYRLNVASRELFCDEAPITLRTAVFDGLLYLIENRSRAVGRDELAAAVWARTDISDSQINQLILRIRRVVGDVTGGTPHLRTVPKFGYQWIAPIAIENAPASIPAALPVQPDTDSGDRLETPDAIPLPPASRPWFRPLAIAATLCVGTLIVFSHIATRFHFTSPTMADATDTRGSSGAVIVLPLVVDGDAAYNWARLGAMDVIADHLRSAGLPVPASERVLALTDAGGNDPVDPDRRSHLSVRAGAAVVVDGRLVRTPTGWKTQLTATREQEAPLHAEADAEDLIGSSRLAANRLLVLLGKRPQDDSEDDRALDEVVQRAEAAMLGHQFELARTILLAAPALAHSEPRLRYSLARVDFQAGDYVKVESELSDLLSSEAVEGNPPLRARVLILRGKARVNADRPPPSPASRPSSLRTRTSKRSIPQRRSIGATASHQPVGSACAQPAHEGGRVRHPGARYAHADAVRQRHLDRRAGCIRCRRAIRIDNDRHPRTRFIARQGPAQ